jgi:hypothetical protein
MAALKPESPQSFMALRPTDLSSSNSYVKAMNLKQLSNRAFVKQFSYTVKCTYLYNINLISFSIVKRFRQFWEAKTGT